MAERLGGRHPAIAGTHHHVDERVPGLVQRAPAHRRAADELDPQLFVDPSDGAVHLVYWVDDGQGNTLAGQSFALTITASLSGEQLLKGLIAGALGLLVATVGEDEINE